MQEGNDPDRLTAFAHQLNTAADQFDGIVQRTSAALHATMWRGVSADRFRQDWSSRYAGMLRGVAATLRDSATTVSRNASQQRQASELDSGPARGGDPGRVVPVSPWDAFLAGKGVFENVHLGKDVIDDVHHLLSDPKKFGGMFVVAGVGALHTGGTLLKDAGKLGRLPAMDVAKHGLRDLGGALSEAGKTVKDVPVLNKIGIGLDVVQVGGGVWQGITTGDWHEAIDGVGHLAWDGAGLIPVVGVVETAWDVGKLAYDHRDAIGGVVSSVANTFAGFFNPAPAKGGGGW